MNIQVKQNAQIVGSPFQYTKILTIPEVQPQYSEFNDPGKYIQELRKKYEHFGAVKIITPEWWKPPFKFPKDPNQKLPIMIQKLSELYLAKVFPLLSHRLTFL